MAASDQLADIRALVQTSGMRITALPTMLVALLSCATQAFAQTNAHSSPEDRRRFVSIVQSLERAPLNPSLQHDREWAIRWLVEAPDVSASACSDPLGGAARGVPYLMRGYGNLLRVDAMEYR